MTTLESSLDRFEAVYYSQQVPATDETLAVLAFLFDRIYFPGVYMPEVELDEPAVRAEIERIRVLARHTVEEHQLLQCMSFALKVRHVRDFCVFTGQPGMMGLLEDGAREMTRRLEELVFGPPPANFFPTPEMGFCKGLPGHGEKELRAQVNAPSWLSYPSNALLFAVKHQLPVINDNPTLPVPGFKSADPKANAKLLATILSIESVRVALPKVAALHPEDLQEFRTQTVKYIKPFRVAMLRLAKDLNNAIESNMTISELQKEARFIAETTIFPEIKEMEKVFYDPTRPWYRRAVDLVKSAPELTANFISMPKNLAIAKLLAKFADTLADLRDEQRDKEHKLGRGGLHYLLKLRQLNRE